MASTFTPNVQIEEPARGDDVGVWDTPVNNNSTLLDLCIGGTTTISLNNSNVVLNAAQFQSRQITFNSTLTGNVIITFPSSFKKDYLISHACTGSSAFTITLSTTTATGQDIAIPPGETIQCFNDGSNLKFMNFGRIGTYSDYAGSSMPNWNDACTIRPFRNCDGTPVSSTEHPVLFGLIGPTLPDARGRTRFALNQGTGRMTSGGGGVDGNTLFAAGGADTQTMTIAQLPAAPPFNPTVTITNQSGILVTDGGLTAPVTGGPVARVTAVGVTATVTGNLGQGQAHTITQPSYVGGLTLIRAG